MPLSPAPFRRRGLVCPQGRPHCLPERPGAFKVTIEQRIAHARWLLERQLAWISSADTKAAGLVAAYMAMVAVAATVLEGSDPIWGEIVLLAMAATLSIIGMAFALMVFMPDVDAPHKSKIFFGGIADRECPAFLPEMASLADDDLLDDLHKQVHVNARIAKSKHWNLQTSIRVGAIGFLLWLLAISVSMTLPGGVGL